ncbi:hypothetical protein B0T14DRAFT_326059 [Immersiella caudata]|uniref:Uncharacterized protein n=1 Tax=Immersiella caudata TaxID=314043 RepID=A0AA39U5A3_9PEZI|nr:hypothetical protein B0T14DRAFT_326059 [Immersiella caudata]
MDKRGNQDAGEQMLWHTIKEERKSYCFMIHPDTQHHRIPTSCHSFTITKMVSLALAALFSAVSATSIALSPVATPTDTSSLSAVPVLASGIDSSSTVVPPVSSTPVSKIPTVSVSSSAQTSSTSSGISISNTTTTPSSSVSASQTPSGGNVTVITITTSTTISCTIPITTASPNGTPYTTTTVFPSIKLITTTVTLPCNYCAHRTQGYAVPTITKVPVADVSPGVGYKPTVTPFKVVEASASGMQVGAGVGFGVVLLMLGIPFV